MLLSLVSSKSMLDDKDSKAGTLKETVVSLKESINKAKLDNDVLSREKGSLEELLRMCELKKGGYMLLRRRLLICFNCFDSLSKEN